jgi:hypothetical protein
MYGEGVGHKCIIESPKEGVQKKKGLAWRVDLSPKNGDDSRKQRSPGPITRFSPLSLTPPTPTPLPSFPLGAVMAGVKNGE